MTTEGASELYSEEAERALLGAMLIDAAAADEIISSLPAEAFYKDTHRKIYKGVAALRAAGKPIDSVMLMDRLKATGEWDALADLLDPLDDGPAHYISTLVGSVPTSANVGHYAGIIREKAADRLLRNRIMRALEAGDKGDREKALAIMEAARAEVAAMAETRRQRVRLVNMADVEPRAVKWLWEPYIPMECITLLEGDPKTGKTWVALAVTAAITRGFPLPGEDGSLVAREPGNVLYLTAEDSIDMTLKPRLEKGNADTRRVQAVEGVTENNGRTVVPINMQNLPELDEALERVKPVLIVIDSMMPHLGPKVDPNKAEQIVPVLNGVSRLAEKHGCACLIIRHFKKGPSERALYKGQGTVSIAGVARSILMVGKDPNNPGKNVIVHSACNLAKEGQSQSFAITDGGALEWCGTSELSAAELVAPEVIEQGGSRAEAAKFLQEALAHGPRPAVEMVDEATANGITDSTLKRARKSLNIQAFKLGKTWYWELPRIKPKEEDHEEGHLV